MSASPKSFDTPLIASPRVSTQSASVLELIGNTPLLRLERTVSRLPGITLLAKAEWINPGGSVKDRAAARIVSQALQTGKLRPGVRLLDSTSGNTGIAYAMLGAIYGFGVILAVPSNASEERKRILRAYGAEVIYTDPGEGSDGAARKAKELYQRHPHAFFYADQYSNEANWKAHYYGTAEEIWRQTHGHLTHFVAALGTSGTFIGTSRRLKELDPAIQCISVQPDSPFHGLEGLKHMLTAMVPAIYDPKLADMNLEVGTEDSYAMVRRLAREEGLLVGISSGAAMLGCLRIAEQISRKGQQAVIVTVFPDSAANYLSQRLWQEEK